MKIDKEKVEYFIRSFRLSRIHKPEYMIKIANHDELVSIGIESSVEDFNDLMNFAIEGRAHAELRHLNPVAQELYDKYMTLYLLTKEK